MKGDYDNNSTIRTSLYKLYYNRSETQWYIIPNNYSFNNDYKRKLIDIKNLTIDF